MFHFNETTDYNRRLKFLYLHFCTSNLAYPEVIAEKCWTSSIFDLGKKKKNFAEQFLTIKSKGWKSLVDIPNQNRNDKDKVSDLWKLQSLFMIQLTAIIQCNQFDASPLNP